MIRLVSVKLPVGYCEKDLLSAAARELRISENRIKKVSLYRKSVDARKGEVTYAVTLDVTVEGDEKKAAKRSRKATLDISREPRLSDFISNKSDLPLSERRVAVIGSGPAGLFAAYILAANGLRPVLLERGRDVDSRSKDMKAFDLGGKPDLESNAFFGEGGAGTFSDGKLNTGISDHRCRFVLRTFYECGAPEEILTEAKPHVGTDRLVGTVKNLREKIIAMGAEVRFESRVTDISVKDGRLTGLYISNKGNSYLLPVSAAVLACGHSARDTYEMLFSRGVMAEPKAFAVGVRIEHPRSMIDGARYGRYAGTEGLAGASYKLVSHATKDRGVYSFCMCPGGQVITCVSEEKGLSVNGMSRFARDMENSNAALLVGISPKDTGGTLTGGIELQRRIERAAFAVSGDYIPPAQLAGDLINRRASLSLGDVKPSCERGVTLCDLRECLPDLVLDPIAAALPDFGRQISGFDRYDALLTGVEARSSAPVRLLRDEGYMSSIAGLFPCGEGAGYAGGITSAAVDGIRVAEAVVSYAK